MDLLRAILLGISEWRSRSIREVPMQPSFAIDLEGSGCMFSPDGAPSVTANLGHEVTQEYQGPDLPPATLGCQNLGKV
jgi:hypothetical protein